MAINKISGNILQDDLQRGANLSIQGNLVYVDIVNTRVGINTNATTHTLTVSGNASISNGLSIGSLSTTGNVNAGNINTTGLANIGTTLSVVGNATVGNLSTAGQVSASGNVTGGNLLTIGIVTATGNITGGNVNTAGQVTATGNVTGGNLVAIGNLVSNGILTTGNITGGNILTSGVVTATGNVTGGNITTAGQVRATGNVTGGNLITAGQVLATGNVTGGNLTTAGNVTANVSIIAIGNVSGGNLTTAGNVTAVGNVSSNYIIANAAIVGNVTVNNLNVTNIIANGYANIVGNVTGGNITTAGQVLATGNVTGANINLSGNIVDSNALYLITSTAGNITLAPNGVETLIATTTGANVTGTFAVTGNANVGNLGTAGLITATGNITGGNINTAGNLVSTGILTSGNITGGNLLTPGLITATGNITGGNISTAGNLTVTGNINVDNLVIAGNTITSSLASGNIVLDPTGTGVVIIDTTTSLIIPVGNTDQRPASPVVGMFRFNTFTQNIEVYNGIEWENIAGQDPFTITNQTISPNGVANAFTLTQTATSASILLTINGVNQTPDIDYSVTGNSLSLSDTPLSSDIIQVRFLAGIDSVDFLTNTTGNAIVQVLANGSINITTGPGGNVYTSSITPTANASFSLGTATNNWTDAYLSGNLKVGNINNSNANGVGNIGSSTTYFNTVFAKATSAQYADLAEKFTADQVYSSGTVLVHGGEFQVTLSTKYADSRAAGIVTTNPAHLMNAELQQTSAAIALAGQVPCLVRGPVSKGDVLTTSNHPGHAEKLDPQDWQPGVVVAKALEDCGSGLHTILVSVKH